MIMCDAITKMDEDIKKEVRNLYKVDRDLAVQFLDEIKSKFNLGDDNYISKNYSGLLKSGQLLLLTPKKDKKKQLFCVIRRAYTSNIADMRILYKIDNKYIPDNYCVEIIANSEKYYTRANEMSVKVNLKECNFEILKEKNGDMMIPYEKGLELCLREADAIIDEISIKY